MAATTPEDGAKLRRERDFFLRLLELQEEELVDSFLDDALSLILETSWAQHGYLELHHPYDQPDRPPRWWSARECSDTHVQSIRESISQGIIAEALATGKTVHTACAREDERFATRASVRTNKIDSVLCAPIGTPPVGVVYLQGRSGGGRFDKDTVELVEAFARYVAPGARRVVDRHSGGPTGDPTLPFRAKLHVCSDIIGRSAAMAQVLERVTIVAPTDLLVLLTGRSGTGKTALARTIHANSKRAHAPFVEVNCAAIPETLIEKELFGAVRGAYTDARSDQKGRVQAAQGGVLFLDEIGDLSPSAQAKVLQLLQSRVYYPVGSSDPRTADVRVIAATNQDLESSVGEKRFREDLYFRINVFPIEVPPLAERPEDLESLAAYFCRRAVARGSEAAPGELRMTRRAIRAIEDWDWVGNVRELQNRIESAVAWARGQDSDVIDVQHVFPNRRKQQQVEERPEYPPYRDAVRRYRRRLAVDALRDTDWNVAKAARRLDIQRSHLYNLINEFGLKRSTAEDDD